MNQYQHSPSNRLCNNSLTWQEVITNGDTPPARSGAASVIIDGKLYIFGGYGGGTGRLDDFYAYDFERNEWDQVEVLSEERPSCRENNGAVASGDSRRLCLFGGYNGRQWLNDLWVFDLASKRWTCIQESSDPTNDAESATKVPSRRFGYVSVVHRNKFILFGGFDGTSWLNDMWEFSFETKEWKCVQARGQLPSARSCPAWVQDESHVYIIGGYDGLERKADFFACNLLTYEWREMPSRGTPPSPRYFHSCCIFGNKIIVYGGYNGSQRLADMYLYDFDSREWSQVACNGGCVSGGVDYTDGRSNNSPCGRSSLVAQVYNSYFYVFGGYNGDTVLNDFYRYRLQSTSILLPSLLCDLRKLINNESFSDCTFVVDGHLVHANRALLAVRSEYFYALLYGSSMRESIQVQEQDTNDGPTCSGRERVPIVIKDVPYPVFMKVIEYLYTDGIQDMSTDLGIQVLISSELFMLDRLKALCEDIIRRDLNIGNVFEVLVASYRHGAGGLKDIALQFILNNISKSAILEGMAGLKSEPDLLLEIIRQSATLQGRDCPAPSSPFSRSEWSGTRR
mmetsp:Transcript_4058/g.7783  ORF Transcript_4058/g.7783 Transcript_4058/m.7783 type:complete len:567 (+) Transcript_4058:464-2164(+)|eukprot:CAMPEP_0176506322 /NCGR_PEP_ID=MMETSP0200_2-20121128/16968_1 /TAXON_ID=947934 /ORGANISM="Chaetoceros sp., Strain GSL56" /LENGTH=566 /DNA_ID=CAMNT_0017905939 /DNA_START=1718 /DNA_END=3418 /DNA_ORIENTATION=+